MAGCGSPTAVAGVGGLLTLRGWGCVCDRFGSKPVLYVCSLVWALTSPRMLGVGGRAVLLAPRLLLPGGGATTAGFQLCQFNLMLKLSPANKAPYVAVFLALTSLLTAFGPLLGGALLRWLPDEFRIVSGSRIRDYHLLISFSMIGCLQRSPPRLRSGRAGARPEDVWRTLRRMSPFN